MEKLKSKTKKDFALSTLCLLSAFSSIATIALINRTTSLTVTNHLNPIINSNLNKVNRSITDNITNAQDVRNPDEVFYTDQDLATKDV